MSVASENFQICFPQNFSDASEFFHLFSSIWFWSVRNKIKKLSVTTDKFNCVDFAYPLWDTKCARTREWEIVNLWKIQVALKSRLFWKCVRTVFFFNQGWFQVDLKSRKNSWVALKSKLFSKCARTVLWNQV